MTCIRVSDKNLIAVFLRASLWCRQKVTKHLLDSIILCYYGNKTRYNWHKVSTRSGEDIWLLFLTILSCLCYCTVRYQSCPSAFPTTVEFSKQRDLAVAREITTALSPIMKFSWDLTHLSRWHIPQISSLSFHLMQELQLAHLKHHVHSVCHILVDTLHWLFFH